jgi:hypothetical protein
MDGSNSILNVFLCAFLSANAGQKTKFIMNIRLLITILLMNNPNRSFLTSIRFLVSILKQPKIELKKVETYENSTKIPNVISLSGFLFSIGKTVGKQYHSK